MLNSPEPHVLRWVKEVNVTSACYSLKKKRLQIG